MFAPSSFLFLRSTQMYQSQIMTQFQYQEFGNLQQRINRRLRRYRQDKIQKESSFNKNEGIYDLYLTFLSAECLLPKERCPISRR